MKRYMLIPIHGMFTCTIQMNRQLSGGAPTEDEPIWLLHIAAQPFGAWPSKVALYWDGSEVLCDATSENQG